jgi:hypothetical protein
VLKDPEVLKLTGSVHGDEAEAEPDDWSRVEQLRRWYRERNAQPDRLDLAVVDKASSQCGASTRMARPFQALTNNAIVDEQIASR